MSDPKQLHRFHFLEHPLLHWLSVFADLVGVITWLVGVVGLQQRPLEDFTYNALFIGLILITTASIYVAFFARRPGPVTIDGVIRFVPTYPLLRRAALSLLIVLPLITSVALGFQQWSQREKIDILVADLALEARFERSSDRTIIQTIIDEISALGKENGRLHVIPLKEIILDDTVARQRNSQRHGSLLIYGWYSQTDTGTILNVSFLLSPELASKYPGVNNITGKYEKIDLMPMKFRWPQEKLSLYSMVIGLASYNQEEKRPFPSSRDEVQRFADWANYVFLARAYYTSSEFDAALLELKAAVELDSENACMQSNLGALYYQQSNLDEALRRYRDAIRIDFASAEAHNNLAVMYAAQSEFPLAVASFEKAASLNPKLVQVKKNLELSYRNWRAKSDPQNDYKVIWCDATLLPKYEPRSAGSFGWPAPGLITQKYWDKHPAVDIGAPENTPVMASDGGVVIYAAWPRVGSLAGFGNLIVIDHGNGYQTRYGQLNTYAVDVGEVVKKGQVIGRVGSTGNSTGPHLHFQIQFEGEPRNPFALLPGK